MSDERNHTLGALSDALAAVVDEQGRSIVRVEARRRGHSSGIAWSAGGLVITAHHTVQRDEDLGIGLPDGEVVPATLVGRDPTTDVAVLRAEDAELAPPGWAGIEALRVGHLALSVGRHDANAQASLGIVAKKSGPWRTKAGGTVDTYLQTDIAVYPGFSGSALVDVEGRAYGMNTSWFGRRSSLTIPHETLRRTVDLLVEHGQVRRGLLGVSAHVVQLPPSAAETLDQQTGLLVGSVEPDSPADRAGLLVGDLIVTFDGAPTPRLDALMALLTEERIGQAVPLQIVRGGLLDERSVTPTEH